MTRLFALIRRDVPPGYATPLRFLKLFLFGQGYRLMLNYRVGRALSQARGPLRLLAPFLKRAQYRKWACDVSFKADIGDRISLPHPIGIVIGEGVVIGDDAKIFQQVTIGSHGRADHEKRYPTIGKRVTLYAGAKVLGAVTIGDGAVIGANAVVTRDIPAGVRAAGVPARPL